MSQIPANEVSQKDLEEWYKVQEELSALKSREILLRNKIFKGLFTDPKEGTNTHTLSDGYAIKGQHVINRSVDVASLTNMREELDKAKVPVESLIKYKPELAVAEYRKLNDEQRAMFDAVLIIKPGTPQLEIVKPKRAS